MLGFFSRWDLIVLLVPMRLVSPLFIVSFHFHESSCSLRFRWLTIAQSCLLPTGYSLLIVKLASVTRDEGTRSSYEFLTRFAALFSPHRLSK